MTEDELNEIEARCNAATPGPWDAYVCHEADDEDNEDCCDVHGPRSVEPGDDYRYLCHDDAGFIANARTDVPSLIAEVRRLQGLVRSVAAGVQSDPL